jgi:hypothetical protein
LATEEKWPFDCPPGKPAPLKEKSGSLAALGIKILGTAIHRGDSVDIDLRGEGR